MLTPIAKKLHFQFEYTYVRPEDVTHFTQILLCLVTLNPLDAGKFSIAEDLKVMVWQEMSSAYLPQLYGFPP